MGGNLKKPGGSKISRSEKKLREKIAKMKNERKFEILLTTKGEKKDKKRD